MNDEDKITILRDTVDLMSEDWYHAANILRVIVDELYEDNPVCYIRAGMKLNSLLHDMYANKTLDKLPPDWDKWGKHDEF